MARPLKNGLDYFSLDCQLDDKFKLVIAEFGMLGFAIVTRIYQKIYGEEGYYVYWDHDVSLLFANENFVGHNLVSQVVLACLKRKIFDQAKYDEFSILTSNGIQKRYCEMTKRRKENFVRNEYVVFSALKNTSIDNNNQDTAYNNEQNVCSNEQSKVKESKVIDIISDFETLLGSTLSSNDMRNIQELIECYDSDVVRKAIEQATSNEGRSVQYVVRILQNWFRDGVRTADEAESMVKNFKNRKKENKQLLEEE